VAGFLLYVHSNQLYIFADTLVSCSTCIVTNCIFLQLLIHSLSFIVDGIEVAKKVGTLEFLETLKTPVVMDDQPDKVINFLYKQMYTCILLLLLQNDISIVL
jgi:hypothetical protein